MSDELLQPKTHPWGHRTTPLVYISSSWKNRERVREVANLLRSKGFSAYDFTDPRCRETEEIPPKKFPKQFDPEIHVYSYYLNRPEWREAVEENRRTLNTCNAVILLLPCGIDATADWAYAVGRGVPSVVVGHPRKGERSPVHLWADAMVETVEEAVELLCTDLRGPAWEVGEHRKESSDG
jgi:hypothetical protein